MIKPELIDNALQRSVDSKMLFDIFSWPLLDAIIKIWSHLAPLLLFQSPLFGMEVFEGKSGKCSFEMLSCFVKNISFVAGVVSDDSL